MKVLRTIATILSLPGVRTWLCETAWPVIRERVAPRPRQKVTVRAGDPLPGPITKPRTESPPPPPGPRVTNEAATLSAPPLIAANPDLLRTVNRLSRDLAERQGAADIISGSPALCTMWARYAALLPGLADQSGEVQRELLCIYDQWAESGPDTPRTLPSAVIQNLHEQYRLALETELKRHNLMDEWGSVRSLWGK